ncbi:MAG: tryptophan--tRNA ligase [Candidatus Micrarchaeota archaeon]
MDTIDPWSNELVNYEKLFTEFGMQKVDEGILKRMKNKNRLFRRGIIFAHRDFDKFLSAHEHRKPIAAMSGIKPTGDFHLGSKLTAEELIFLQKEFGAKVFYGIADLEAYEDNGLSLEEGAESAVGNVADLLALGLDPDNAYIWKQSREGNVMRLSFIFARKVTLAMLKALYGERPIGLYFTVLTQAGDILLPQLKEFGGPKMTVVPVGADQDPHIRLARDIAQKFISEYKFIIPGATYHKFFRSLNGEFKMSKRDQMNILTLGDDPKLAEKKVMNALTGGRATVEEQKRLGAEWNKCVIAELCAFHFEEDDRELNERMQGCLCGTLMCGECKRQIAAKVVAYLKQHQEKRKRMLPKAKEILGADEQV